MLTIYYSMNPPSRRGSAEAGPGAKLPSPPPPPPILSPPTSTPSFIDMDRIQDLAYVNLILAAMDPLKDFDLQQRATPGEEEEEEEEGEETCKKVATPPPPSQTHPAS